VALDTWRKSELAAVPEREAARHHLSRRLRVSRRAYEHRDDRRRAATVNDNGSLGRRDRPADPANRARRQVKAIFIENMNDRA